MLTVHRVVGLPAFPPPYNIATLKDLLRGSRGCNNDIAMDKLTYGALIDDINTMNT